MITADEINELLYSESLAELEARRAQLLLEHTDVFSKNLIQQAYENRKARLTDPLATPAELNQYMNPEAFSDVKVEVLPGVAVSPGSPVAGAIRGFGNSSVGQFFAGVARFFGLVGSEEYEEYKKGVPPGSEVRWSRLIVILFLGLIGLILGIYAIRQVLKG